MDSFTSYPYSGFICSVLSGSLNRIRRDTKYLSVFSSNAGKHGPENSDYRHFSHSDFIYIKFGRRKDILFNLLISNFLFVFELFKILHQNENY